MSRARTGFCISWANSSGVFEAQKEPVEERVTTAHVVEGSGHAWQDLRQLSTRWRCRRCSRRAGPPDGTLGKLGQNSRALGPGALSTKPRLMPNGSHGRPVGPIALCRRQSASMLTCAGSTTSFWCGSQITTAQANYDDYDKGRSQPHAGRQLRAESLGSIQRAWQRFGMVRGLLARQLPRCAN